MRPAFSLIPQPDLRRLTCNEPEAAPASPHPLLALVSHELRRPLASIRWAAEVLADPAASPSQQREAVAIVRRQSHAMQVLVDDLLDTAALQLDCLRLRPEPTNLDHIVLTAREMVLAHFDQRPLDIHLPPESVPLHGDPLRLAQVLANLLANAAKFTPGLGRIVLRASLAPGKVCVEVEDSGVGMDPAELESVFGFLSQGQAGKEAQVAARGLGIGLALSRALAERHGGTLVAFSEGRGTGTRMTLTLPTAGQGRP